MVLVKTFAFAGALLTMLVGCGSTEDAAPPDVPVPEGIPELPDALAAMDTAEPTRRIYISASHACENESLNDGTVEACDGTAGPFASRLAS